MAKTAVAPAPSNVVQIETRKAVQITPPDIRTVAFNLIGTAPFVQLRFSQKTLDGFVEKFTNDAPASKKRVHKKRDFEADFLAAQHISEEGWIGVPAGAFRAAMISACRLVGFKMTLAKLSVFVVADGYDKVDGVPLVRLEGKPEILTMMVRNANGQPDLRTRAQFRKWSLTLRVRYDAQQFCLDDIANLVSRVGNQVGIGEGRPDSRESAGMGWGTFRLADEGESVDIAPLKRTRKAK